MITIYDYLDYRIYLRDYCEWQRSNSKSFSFRKFAMDAGFSSPSYLKMVMDGERGLTPNSIRKFAKALRLKRHEERFFEDLVWFTQAKSHDEKNHHYKKLTTSRRFLKVRHIENDQFEYFSKWYYAVIREMVTIPGFKEDPVWIARKLRPTITVTEAKATIELLLRLGLLKRDESGRLVQTDKTVATADEVKSLALGNFHREMIHKAAEAVTNNKARHRNISSLTVALSREKFNEVKQRINEFRKELRSLLEECETPQAIYQINFQLFHLTEVTDEA